MNKESKGRTPKLQKRTREEISRAPSLLQVDHLEAKGTRLKSSQYGWRNEQRDSVPMTIKNPALYDNQLNVQDQ